MPVHPEVVLDEPGQPPVAGRHPDLPDLLGEAGSQEGLVDVAPLAEADGLPVAEAVLEVAVVLLGQGKHLIDGLADGDGVDVVGAVVLDKLHDRVVVAHLETGGRDGRLGGQPEVAAHGLGGLVPDQLDEDVTVGAAVEGLGGEPEIVGCCGCPPASGEQFVRLLNSVGSEVPEIGLQEFLVVVSQRYLS